jgi:hypothetical protein
MKKSQNYLVSMNLTSQAELNENAGKFESITAYPPLKANLDNSIGMEQELANSQETHKKNSTAARNAARHVADEFTLELASKIRSYAIVKGDMTLLDKVKINESKFRRSSDNANVLIIETILICAGENLPGLIDYGVTEETLNDGSALLESYKIEIQKLAISKIELKQLTVQLEQQLKITDSYLKTIDAMVETMRVSDPAWYRLYWNARTVKKGPGSRVSATGKVFDSLTSQPLPGAVMNITRSENGKALNATPELVKTVKIRSAGGGFMLKSLPTGTYLFQVTYAGYQDQEQTVYINEGVLTKVVMPLSKIA